MANKMRINGREVPMGGMVLCFRYFEDEVPPYASVDIWRETEDDAVGGVGLNGLALRGVTTLKALEGKRFAFGDQTEEDAELRESVFVQPNNHESLEINSVAITFGRLRDKSVELEIRASCFDSRVSDIPVEIQGAARILDEC